MTIQPQKGRGFGDRKSAAIDQGIVLAALWIGLLKLIDLRVWPHLLWTNQPEAWLLGVWIEAGPLGLTLPTWILLTNVLLMLYLWARLRSRLGRVGRRGKQLALALALVLLVATQFQVAGIADDLPSRIDYYTTEDGLVVMPWQIPW